jgi:hypothetical protein
LLHRGDIFFTDYINNVIRKINSAGVVSTFSGNSDATTFKDGGPITASFSNPYGISWSPLGYFGVSDNGYQRYSVIFVFLRFFISRLFNSLFAVRFRKISIAGSVSTIAGRAATGSVDGILS